MMIVGSFDVNRESFSGFLILRNNFAGHRHIDGNTPAGDANVCVSLRRRKKADKERPETLFEAGELRGGYPAIELPKLNVEPADPSFGD